MARHEPRYTLSTLDGLFVECAATVRYNVAPGQDAWVVRARAGRAREAREAVSLRWGLLPRWKGHGGTRGPMIDAAPLEAVPQAPLLRDAFKKQRCLVLADGCYAWTALKQPVWFHPEPRRVIAFAGVWAENRDDGVPSFAMLTGEPLVTRVTETMPIVIGETDYDGWLTGDPDSALAAAAPRPLDGWRSDNVTTWMTAADHDDPRCIAAAGNPLQGELF